MMSRRERRAKEKEEQAKEEQQLQRGMLKRAENKRNENQICLNCRFWEFEDRGGKCKRYPPTVRSGPTNRIDMWDFPEVTYDKWCGEWQPFSNKDGYYAVASPIDDIDDEE